MLPSREIRRAERATSDGEAREILARASHGVLATTGADGWPYAVPLNHVLLGDVLYVHCATQGHKLDNIAAGERVSYCAVASAQVVPEKLTTFYESAIVFGRASLVADPDEKRRALELLAGRFCGSVTPAAAKAIESLCDRTAVIRVRIEALTGKVHRPSLA
jgi:uncharacterized protein